MSKPPSIKHQDLETKTAISSRLKTSTLVIVLFISICSSFFLAFFSLWSGLVALTNQPSAPASNTDTNTNQSVPLGCCQRIRECRDGVARKSCNEIGGEWQQYGICWAAWAAGQREYEQNCNTCSGQCYTKSATLSAKGLTLLLTANSFKNQVLKNLKCLSASEGGTVKNGQLVCKKILNNSYATCCRLTRVDISNLVFQSEGEDQCTGGGSSGSFPPGVEPGFQPESGGSAEDCAVNVLMDIANSTMSSECQGGNDCGYEVKGNGYLEILECPDQGCLVKENVTWEKICKPVEVPGGEYKISGTISASQSCRLQQKSK